MEPSKRKQDEMLRRGYLFVEVSQFAERMGHGSGPYTLVQQEVRRLVEAWLASGKKLDILFKSDPELEKVARTFKAAIVASRSGRARLAYSSDPNLSNPNDPKRIAVEDFFGFLLNPSNDVLRGPCAYCWKYFANLTRRKKMKFCSAKCGKLYTSRSTNRARRKSEHERLLARAKKAIGEWKTKRTAPDWKTWVFKRTRISKNWLTRAVSRGELLEPRRTGSATQRDN
jgi:hypothetical protein